MIIHKYIYSVYIFKIKAKHQELGIYIPNNYNAIFCMHWDFRNTKHNIYIKFGIAKYLQPTKKTKV